MKDKVVKLWNEGKSSGLIAQELHMTRNQVMGFIWRAQKAGAAVKRVEPRKKLPRPERSPKPKAVALVFRPPKPQLKVVEEIVKPVVPPPPPEKKDDSKPKTILQLTAYDCRWILPNGEYCGKHSESALSPWCPEHKKIVYVQGTGKKLGGKFRF